MDIRQRIIAVPRRLLFDRDYFWYLASLLLIGELVFNGLIINKVACKWIIFYQRHTHAMSLSYVYWHCRHWNWLGGLYARGERVLGWWARLHAVARRYWTSRVSATRFGRMVVAWYLWIPPFCKGIQQDSSMCIQHSITLRISATTFDLLNTYLQAFTLQHRPLFLPSTINPKRSRLIRLFFFVSPNVSTPSTSFDASMIPLPCFSCIVVY